MHRSNDKQGPQVCKHWFSAWYKDGLNRVSDKVRLKPLPELLEEADFKFISHLLTNPQWTDKSGNKRHFSTLAQAYERWRASKKSEHREACSRLLDIHTRAHGTPTRTKWTAIEKATAKKEGLRRLSEAFKPERQEKRAQLTCHR